MRGRLLLILLISTAVLAGCARHPELPYVDSKEVEKLKPEMKEKVHSILAHYCGIPQSPRLLGNDQLSPAHLKRGVEVYSRYCIQCHGSTGDGNGVAAAYMIPKPRDYRAGIFKFTSTTYGVEAVAGRLVTHGSSVASAERRCRRSTCCRPMTRKRSSTTF